MHKRTKAARSGPPRSHGDPPLQDLAETTRPARTGIDREQPSFLDDEKGSPARTGMYPRDGRTKSSTHRAPRADGDPPDAIEALRVRIGVAPGARGYTLGDRLKQRVALGCPARTGIHLGQTCAHPGRTRLPRTHGDPPLELITNLPRQGITPRARGSTKGFRKPWSRSHVPRKHGDSPVSVGLSLAVNRPARTGIDPRAFSCSVGRAQVAPHGRGWTLMSLGTVRGIRGRPARTGIDRNLTATLPGRRRVPRTHGGGPRCTPSQPPRPATDPARTGIYLRWMWESASSGALPRTHGERPKNYASG